MVVLELLLEVDAVTVASGGCCLSSPARTPLAGPQLSRDSGVDAKAAASILSEATGKPFRYVRQLSGGETGAHQFIGPHGRPIVVKWDTAPEGRAFRGEAVLLSERLRCEEGWPVPAESVIDAEGVSFIIQEFMPGSPPTARSWTPRSAVGPSLTPSRNGRST